VLEGLLCGIIPKLSPVCTAGKLLYDLNFLWKIASSLMPKRDGANEFLDGLVPFEPTDTFCFRCGPDVSCFNECCADLNAVLSPYDVLRLRRALGLSSKDFLGQYAQMSKTADSGFPVVSLKMLDESPKACPFVRERGCLVYNDRPGACRMYPLGRAGEVDARGGIEERFVLVRESHCKGFSRDTEWTVDAWLSDQAMDEYLVLGDQYARFMSWWSGRGRVLKAEEFGTVFIALYRLDDFAGFIESDRLFEDQEILVASQAEILSDETARLEFALKWLPHYLKR
jgi:uncharacterized protein